MGEWGGAGWGQELSPGLSAAAGRWSHREEGLASFAGTQRTALAVAGKQLRVAGQECALPPGKLSAAATEAGTCESQARQPGRLLRSIPCRTRRRFPASAPELSSPGWASGSSRPQVKACPPSPPRPPLAASPPTESEAPLLALGEAPSPIGSPQKTRLGRRKADPDLPALRYPRGAPQASQRHLS